MEAALAKHQPRRAVPSKLRSAREERGLSLEQLAVAAGISRSTLHLAERAPSLMTTRTAELVAKALGVEPEALR